MTDIENLLHFSTGYNLEMELLLTWYPTTAPARIEHPQLMGHTSTYASADGTTPVSWGYGPAKIEGQIFVNQNGIFEVILALKLGKVERKKHVVVPPSTQLPIMINVLVSSADKAIMATSAVLQGVLTTTPPISLGSVFAAAVARMTKP